MEMSGNVQHPEFPPGMLLHVPTWAAPILSVAMRMRPCIGFGTPIVAGQTLRKWWYCWRNLKWRHTRVPQNHPSHCFWSMGKNNVGFLYFRKPQIQGLDVNDAECNNHWISLWNIIYQYNWQVWPPVVIWWTHVFDPDPWHTHKKKNVAWNAWNG